MALRVPAFRTMSNLAAVGESAALFGVMACGEAVVLLCGGLDLSVGSILALSSCACAAGLAAGLPWPLCALLCLVAGAAAGSINGFLVTRRRIPPILATLATLLLFRHGVSILTASRNYGPFPPAFGRIGTGWTPTVIFAVCVVGFAFLTLRVRIGRWMLAVGGGEAATRLSGVPTDRVKRIGYLLSGLCAGLAGLIAAAFNNTTQSSVGQGYELDVIAACVVGGVRVTGGDGSVLGAGLGALLIALVRDLFILTGRPEEQRGLIVGAVILGAALLERLNARAPETAAAPPTGANAQGQNPSYAGVAIVLLLVALIFSWRLPDFRSVENLRLLVKQSGELALIATGMTLVIATGGIDISVGSVLGLCAMTLGWVSGRTGGNLALACSAAIAVGGLCGLVNGVLIARSKLPPILATLAMYAAARAGAEILGGGGSLSNLPGALNDLMDRTQLAGLPLLLWLSLAALGAGALLVRRTRFGRQVLALGGNLTATRLSGVPTARTLTQVYGISGLLAGCAAVIDVALKSTATPDAGQYLELTAITAVVLGGTSIAGGQATLLGTGLGVLTITAAISGVRLGGQEDRVAWFLIGAALLLAVEVQRARRRTAATG